MCAKPEIETLMCVFMYGPLIFMWILLIEKQFALWITFAFRYALRIYLV